MKAIGGAEGIGIGKAYIYQKSEINIEKYKTDNFLEEIDKLKKAQEKSKKEIEILYMKALSDVGEEESQIFKAHGMILEDPEFIDRIQKKIKDERVCASWALDSVSKDFIAMFESMDNEYMKERATDIKDVSSNLQRNILNIKTNDISLMEKGVIIIAKDLSPSDTILLDKNKVEGFIVEKGGKTSHAAILARSLEMPAIVGANSIMNDISDGDIIAMDGAEGVYVINPSSNELDEFLENREKLIEEKNRLKHMIGKKTQSLDGYNVKVEGNIGSLDDLEKVIENDGEGIGLFRTEFLFMGRNAMPSEEEQFIVYREVAEKMMGKPVVIRTLDVGGDKDISYFEMPEEMNPFLGYRAIRFCLKEVEIFKVQLRALLRAGNYGNVKIMFPMISSMEELLEAKDILEEAKEELRRADIAFNENIEVGIMIEIPSAAIISDLLAKEVDFFSIGTNDLMQYTYAVDRMNDNISSLYTSYHPALLRLIKTVIDNGHKNGIKVAMCGQVAGEPRLIPVLLGMGLDEFSTSSSSILRTRDVINNNSKKDMLEFVEKLLELPSAVEVEKAIIKILN